MTDKDLLRNLGIARAQLSELRRGVDEAQRVRVDAVIHVVMIVREEIERRAEGSDE